MPRSNDATLEPRACGFNGVRINVPVHVDSGLMLDCFVGTSREDCFHHVFWVSEPLVGHDYIHIRTNVFSDVLSQGSDLHLPRGRTGDRSTNL